ncbi:hypothetical protein [Rhodopseudomonas telluris]|uniref:Uncharacterized protein n=1 Tax=Rhodopseudomonas telluris TaxID=644215 RepID=A0ABV6EZI9_9BRAD
MKGSFWGGFLSCYLVVAFLWGSLVYRLDRPWHSAIQNGLSWPINFVALAILSDIKREQEQ